MRILAKACFLLFPFLIVSCNSTKTAESTSETFDRLLDESLSKSHNQMVGVSMSVFAPSLSLHYLGAAGFDSKNLDHELSVSQPFRIASVTKTFVAATILRLHEIDSLHIAHSIVEYISDEHEALLRNGGYHPEKITIKQCLQHTSGLFDYAMGGNTYEQMVLKNPKRKWSRTDQLSLAMEIGKPYGAPGELFHYSDTGYILLGEIIERITGTNLGESLRNLLKYKQNQMNTTWLEAIESQPAEVERFVSRYLENHNATDWDPSIDLFGGGGLISTTEDLSRFSFYLFNGGIFENNQTLEVMLGEPEVISPNKSNYHCGLYGHSLFGTKIYMHKGMWGTQIVYIPAYRCAIAINYANIYHDRLLKKVVLVLKKIIENE